MTLASISDLAAQHSRLRPRRGPNAALRAIRHSIIAPAGTGSAPGAGQQPERLLPGRNAGQSEPPTNTVASSGAGLGVHCDPLFFAKGSRAPPTSTLRLLVPPQSRLPPRDQPSESDRNHPTRLDHPRARPVGTRDHPRARRVGARRRRVRDPHAVYMAADNGRRHRAVATRRMGRGRGGQRGRNCRAGEENCSRATCADRAASWKSPCHGISPSVVWESHLTHETMRPVASVASGLRLPLGGALLITDHTGCWAFSIAFSSDGGLLGAANETSSTVTVFAVAPGGVLMPVASRTWTGSFPTW